MRQKPFNETALRGLPPKLAAKTRRTRWALGLGRFARAFWPVWVAAAVVAALVLIGAPGALSPDGAVALFALCALVVVGLIVRGVLRFSLPTRREALDTLDAGLARRAASGLDDTVATGGPDTQSLWRAHRARLEEEARAATPPKADIDLTEEDPWNLRYAAALVLLCGIAGSQLGVPRAIEGILVPAGSFLPDPEPPQVEAWIAPPAYTGDPPVYLTDRMGERIASPSGSEVTLRVIGSEAAPVFTLGALESTATNETGDVWTGKLVAAEDGTLSVSSAGTVLATWDIDAIQDAAPVVLFREPPSATDKKALQIDYDAWDDYGLTGAWAEIALARDGAPDEPIRLDLPLGIAADDGAYSGRVAEDLTAHPWAGLLVRMTLHARDGAEQVGVSDPVEITLPTRVFTEPMAKALLEERRELAWDEALSVDTADRLDAVLEYPDSYFKDPTAYLSASFAQKRLLTAVDSETGEGLPAARAEAIELLWRAALRLEDGTLSDALEQLREAQQRLSDALERGAPEEEIAKLMDELREAIDNYMQALANEARQNPDALAQQGQQQGEEMNRSSLEDLLNQLEETARNGDPDQARQMLSMLQQLLENLQMAQGGQGQGQQQQGGAAQQLQEMIQRQQDLADETFESLREGREGQQGQQGQQGQNQPGQGQRGQQQGQGQQGEGQDGQQGQGNRQAGPSGQNGQSGQRPDGSWGVDPQNGAGQGQSGRSDLAGRQGELRDELGDVRGGAAGESEAARDALRRADRAMGRAREGLTEGDLGAALDDQVQALDELREGAQALAEAQQQQQQQNGEGNNGQFGGARGVAGGRLDPFGRLGRSFGPDDGDEVAVPEERARNRALEIQRELRRRSSERERDAEELDYLERLQDRF